MVSPHLKFCSASATAYKWASKKWTEQLKLYESEVAKEIEKEHNEK
jgi:hypothetical protein